MLSTIVDDDELDDVDVVVDDFFDLSLAASVPLAVRSPVNDIVTTVDVVLRTLRHPNDNISALAFAFHARQFEPSKGRMTIPAAFRVAMAARSDIELVAMITIIETLICTILDCTSL